MQIYFGLLSFLIIVFGTIPYCIDIVKYRAKPSKSTRIMYIWLLTLGILQSNDLGSTYSLFLLFGEILQGSVVLVLSLKYGQGGLTYIDKICYLLLTINTIYWVLFANSIIGIILTMTADLIATAPTIIKTYKQPKSETPLFWFLGGLAGFIAIFAEPTFAISTIAFPLYLIVANIFVFLLALRKTDNKSISLEYENVC